MKYAHVSVFLALPSCTLGALSINSCASATSKPMATATATAVVPPSLRDEQAKAWVGCFSRFTKDMCKRADELTAEVYGGPVETMSPDSQRRLECMSDVLQTLEEAEEAKCQLLCGNCYGEHLYQTALDCGAYYPQPFDEASRRCSTPLKKGHSSAPLGQPTVRDCLTGGCANMRDAAPSAQAQPQALSDGPDSRGVGAARALRPRHPLQRTAGAAAPEVGDRQRYLLRRPDGRSTRVLA
jgi:hypothetical protein